MSGSQSKKVLLLTLMFSACVSAAPVEPLRTVASTAGATGVPVACNVMESVQATVSGFSADDPETKMFQARTSKWLSTLGYVNQPSSATKLNFSVIAGESTSGCSSAAEAQHICTAKLDVTAPNGTITHYIHAARTCRGRESDPTTDEFQICQAAFAQLNFPSCLPDTTPMLGSNLALDNAHTVLQGLFNPPFWNANAFVNVSKAEIRNYEQMPGAFILKQGETFSGFNVLYIEGPAKSDGSTAKHVFHVTPSEILPFMKKFIEQYPDVSSGYANIISAQSMDDTFDSFKLSISIDPKPLSASSANDPSKGNSRPLQLLISDKTGVVKIYPQDTALQGDQNGYNSYFPERHGWVTMLLKTIRLASLTFVKFDFLSGKYISHSTPNLDVFCGGAQPYNPDYAELVFGRNNPDWVGLSWTSTRPEAPGGVMFYNVPTGTQFCLTDLAKPIITAQENPKIQHALDGAHLIVENNGKVLWYNLDDLKRGKRTPTRMFDFSKYQRPNEYFLIREMLSENLFTVVRTKDDPDAHNASEMHPMPSELLIVKPNYDSTADMLKLADLDQLSPHEWVNYNGAISIENDRFKFQTTQEDSIWNWHYRNIVTYLAYPNEHTVGQISIQRDP